MRVLRFVTAVMLTVAAVPASAVPYQCSAGPKSHALAALGPYRHAAACMAPHVAPQAGAPAGVLQAQYGPYMVGGCQPGQTTCLNGWINVCQCYSYGCNYTPTANQCGR